MNISYNWLKRYITLTDDAETVAKLLTSIGLEVGTVEKVQTIPGGLEGLKVGLVKTCIPHPNSDHLHITTVDYGEGDVQIVCGAPNVAAGQKVVVATIGTRLYQGEESFVIKKGKIRGEESLGMLCAEDEIGVGNSHDGIINLPEDTPIGMAVKDYYHVEDDTLIEVDITPNRNDGASHFGVARDLYAKYQAMGRTDVKLLRPEVSQFKIQNSQLTMEVKVENPTACPRYTGVTLKGVTVKESPDWLKKALQTIGLRPINNIVDVTNFVMMEMGQPLHAFDADKIEGRQIVIRNAHDGEKFTTLDGIERTLDSRDLMICDANRPMCIAGVFGGQDSGVSNNTANVFIESANFDPVSIRKTARRHGLNTDASFRYERGCDGNQTMYILKRCATLMQEVAGGEVAMEIVDVVNGKQVAANDERKFPLWQVDFNIDRANRLIGKELPAETIETILRALEIEWTKEGKDYQLQIPRYRVDVQRECDVVEDILRIYGYNNVEFPEKLNTTLSYGEKPNPVQLQTRISEQLTAQGFYEIMNNSLTKMSYYQQGEWMKTCVAIKNPLSQDLGVLRQTLLFGGLESIQRNVNRKNADLRFYEFGRCYHYQQNAEVAEPIEQYTEEQHLGLFLTGNQSAPSWIRKAEKTSFYQLRAYVENILRRLGIAVDKLVYEPAIDPEGETCCGLCQCFSDGLVIKTAGGKVLGYMTIVARELLKRFDIDNPVYYADLYWAELLRQNRQYKVKIDDLPRFPEVSRDFALLVDKAVKFADLRKAAMDTERKLLKSVNLFDVYEGKNLEEGKKSYALNFVLQNADDTLKDKQIEYIMSRLQKTFEEKFGAKLR